MSRSESIREPRASLDEVAEGDAIAVPNDTTNEARALLTVCRITESSHLKAWRRI